MVKVDSDNSFKTQGRIVSLSRGRPDEEGRDRLVTIVIKPNKSGVEHVVDLPIKTKGDFEVIPYQLALVGADVRYSKKYTEWLEGIAKDWELEVLSGSLKGNIYKFSLA